MPPSPTTNRWVQFLRSYGPVSTNDNQFDEHIHRALRKHNIRPLQLNSPHLGEILASLRSDSPSSFVLTGTAGDGKTYICRQVWVELGGTEKQWGKGDHVAELALGQRILVIVKDLTELSANDSEALLRQMARDVASPDTQRIYLIAANHGQLIGKLKLASSDPAVERLYHSLVDQLHREQGDLELRVSLKNLSVNPDLGLIQDVIDQIVDHEGWKDCEGCPVRAAGQICPIWENRNRLQQAHGNTIRVRLQALILLSALNDQHLPIRQLLMLIANAILGHPAVKDRMMSCADVPEILSNNDIERASIYGNLFGANLPARTVANRDPFRKLNVFGIGAETSNAVDNLLVYGADDPALKDLHAEYMLSDPVYGGSPKYLRFQQAYLEAYDQTERQRFLDLLEGQRRRLFFVLPETKAHEFGLWDLTVFRYAGKFLALFNAVHLGQTDRTGMALLIRGLNRLFTGMLVQNEMELVLATSGSLSQSHRSPLLDEIISVQRRQGEEVSLAKSSGAARRIELTVRFARDNDPPAQTLELSPTRYEFLGRVAEGSLPSSFSLECQEDLLAFKAKLLASTQRRRAIFGDDKGRDGELVLRFLKLGDDGHASPKDVVVSA